MSVADPRAETRTPTAPGQTDQTVWTEEEIAEYEGVDTNEGEWYGISTDPWPCPTCGEVFSWVTGAHFVIVAPERDDLLLIAAKCMEIGRNAKIKSYDDVLPAMSIFQWRAMGRPVHGLKKDSRPSR